MELADFNKWKQLGPLADFLQRESVVGAVRFTICPSFSPASLFNFIYSSDSVTLFKLVGGNCVAAELRLTDVNNLGPVTTWTALRETALAAPSCMTLVKDGDTYSHSLRDRITSVDAHWSNPSAREHPHQCSLISAYDRLIALAWPPLAGRRVIVRTGAFAGQEGQIQWADEESNLVSVAVRLMGKQVVLPLSFDDLDIDGYTRIRGPNQPIHLHELT
jgi:hypothetical protein